MQGGAAISVAGGQSFGVAYLLDGAMHNNPYDNLNLPLPFPDALQEFRVETSAQNAQNGFHSGASVNVVTKSGTNLFHGDLFEFFRHHRFNATNPFNAVDPRDRRAARRRAEAQPVRRHARRPDRDRPDVLLRRLPGHARPTSGRRDDVAFVPTPAMLAGDFTAFASAACNTRRQHHAAPRRSSDNRIDPALFSPAALRIAAKLPTTDRPVRPRRRHQPAQTSDEQQAIGKVDFQLSPEPLALRPLHGDDLLLRAAVRRVGQHPVDDAGRPRQPGAVVDARRHDGAEQHRRQQPALRVQPDVDSPHARRLLRAATTSASTPTATSTTTCCSASPAASTSAAAPRTRRSFKTNTYSVGDDFTMIRGNHQFGFGGNVAFWDSLSPANVRSPGPSTSTAASPASASPTSWPGELSTFIQSAPNTLDMKQRYFGLYAQDTWTLSPNMTLNYGLRWEPWFPQQHQNGAIYNFSPDASAPAPAQHRVPAGAARASPIRATRDSRTARPGMHSDWLDFAPRVGFAWDPTGDGRMSIRAGYGWTASSSTPVLHQHRQRAAVGLGGAPDAAGTGRSTNPFAGSRRDQHVPDHLRRQRAVLAERAVPGAAVGPRQHARARWNLSVQRQLGDDMAVSASYIGNYTTNLWDVVTGNPGTIPGRRSPTGPCTLNTTTGPQTFANCSTGVARPPPRAHAANPATGRFIGFLDYFTDHGTQKYNGLLLSVQRRTANGDRRQRQLHALEVQGPSDAGRRRRERRQRLHAAGVDHQPAGGGRGAARRRLRPVRERPAPHLQPDG